MHTWTDRLNTFCEKVPAFLKSHTALGVCVVMEKKSNLIHGFTEIITVIGSVHVFPAPLPGDFN